MSACMDEFARVRSWETDVFRVPLLAFLIGWSLLAGTALAEPPPEIPPEQIVNDAFLGRMREWIANPVLAVTIRSQNKRNAGITAAQIQAMDQQWRKESQTNDQPLISATLTSPLSIYLLRVQAVSAGAYTEIIAVDNKGLNAGQSVSTQDYWQGDEDKFKKTFGVGPNAVFIDKPEFDEKTKAWRSQVSLTVVDPDTKEAIGAITVEVNLTEMLRRTGS
jgi:hypothetical protein